MDRTKFYRAIPELAELDLFATTDWSLTSDLQGDTYSGLGLHRVLALAVAGAEQRIDALLQDHLAKVFTLCEGSAHVDDEVSYAAFDDGTVVRYCAAQGDPQAITNYTCPGVAFLPQGEVPTVAEARAAAHAAGVTKARKEADARRAIAELAEQFPGLVCEAAHRTTLPKNSA